MKNQGKKTREKRLSKSVGPSLMLLHNDLCNMISPFIIYRFNAIRTNTQVCLNVCARVLSDMLFCSENNNFHFRIIFTLLKHVSFCRRTGWSVHLLPKRRSLGSNPGDSSSHWTLVMAQK